MTTESHARKRDAAATKAALLDAAQELFAERGFDRTTVRDIAGHAGANQALLFRYFGSKEALFEAVMTRGCYVRLDATPPERLFAETLRGLLDDDSERRDRSLETYLRSTGNDAAGAALREQLGDAYGQALASLTDEPDAALRADLALAWLLGIGLVRAVTRKDPLASASADDVARLTGPAIRTLLARSE
ncbi:TetR family transcriptional regulator [Amycolatopsis rhabdoformis]|uniref:TetR family transcriptional regulator n=1 Tax=Amycolatopsis rhabdoformis TaxID=1448059 RepID=A0ABZ1IIY0_9PSEU|nr:TetR family transcriptional regulator [Amycolatopsis rhabdoformis]WSE34104.1 TetR family transcriptional regulator [Amycolatopsis rhabdoformis]